MTYLTDKYLNPFTDFGFKKLFGSEANKTILIDFLNTLLEGEESTIVDLTFISNEQLGKQIVDRSVFYSSFPIQEQGQKGNWNLESLQDYPELLTEGVFKSFFAEAELAQLPLEKQREYENSLKYYRDLNNVIDTAFDDGKELGKAEGIELGKAEGILEVARNLLDVLDNDTIALKTGLSVEEIQRLR
ncbi:hypothetical protein EIJ81_01690 [Aliivibrio salmonicida]|uniref:Transposase n=1 Tax=Aliivibrio salmonicida (strain LFI1238) TaxID=316275 RepID=B6EHE8_ALISL|nr:PD-(D/E)XK nuclease family transposase [Aliivibrio salmonicida]AZL83591.1 hypothetical protein EIJ81_01690 [Aliivibrio salmonicida]CAQ80727.1 hypothetical protein VSAL_I3043 [Aliivibrio salmonicida LFI1238]